MSNLDFWRQSVWTPFRDLSSLQKGFDEFFDDLTGSPAISRGQWAFSPACDIEETENHFLVTFDMPGVAKEDIKIEVKENTLVIAGQRTSEKSGNGGRHLTERGFGKFERSFTLPSTVDTERIEASYENGVLRVAVPKAEAVKPRQIKISEGKTGFFEKLMGRKEEKDRDVSPTVEQRI